MTQDDLEQAAFWEKEVCLICMECAEDCECEQPQLVGAVHLLAFLERLEKGE